MQCCVMTTRATLVLLIALYWIHLILIRRGIRSRFIGVIVSVLYRNLLIFFFLESVHLRFSKEKYLSYINTL